METQKAEVKTHHVWQGGASSAIDITSLIGSRPTVKKLPRAGIASGKRHRSGGLSFGAHDCKSQHLLRMRLRKARSSVELQATVAAAAAAAAATASAVSTNTTQNPQTNCCSATAKINQLLNKTNAASSRRSSVSQASGCTSGTHSSSPVNATPSSRPKTPTYRPDKLSVQGFRPRMWSLPPTSINSCTLRVPDTSSSSSGNLLPNDLRSTRKVTRDDMHMTIADRFASLDIGDHDHENENDDNDNDNDNYNDNDNDSECNNDHDTDHESKFSDVFTVDIRQRAHTLAASARTQSLDQVAVMNVVYKERFPLATTQMEEKLDQLVTAIDKRLLDAESSAVERFVLVQLDEMCKDVLRKSRDHQLTTRYFYEITENVDKLLADAKEKSVDQSSVDELAQLVKMFLLTIARPARLLECLEFDPAEFYQLLSAAENRVKQVVKTDVPKYITSKLGLRYSEHEASEREQLAAADGSVGSVGSIGSERQVSANEETEKRPESLQAPSESDFEVIKLISNGAYGAVHLVRHRASRQRYALKKIRKQDLIMRNQVDQVYAERDIMIFLDNPFVVTLYCTFETKKHLCLVMEYVEGGDVAALLKHMGPLPLDLARMYFAETVLALEYLHSYGIVHRDLKPDNLLITSIGHIKLTDFGLSKVGLMNLTTNIYEGTAAKKWCHFKDKQVFGTPTYIAPEVILRQGYGTPVDWWALGIILYEFLVGCVPFYGDSAEDLFENIIDGNIEWPEADQALPKEAKLLILALLQQNPAKRLGTNGAQEVREHAFFYGMDWQGLLRIKAEFIPELRNEEDTSYFDSRQDRYNHDADDEPVDVVDSQSGSMASLPTCSGSSVSLSVSTAMLARAASQDSAEYRASDEETMFHSFASLTARYAKNCIAQRHSSISEADAAFLSVGGVQISTSQSTASLEKSSTSKTNADTCGVPKQTSLILSTGMSLDAEDPQPRKETTKVNLTVAATPTLGPQIAVISPETPSPTAANRSIARELDESRTALQSDSSVEKYTIESPAAHGGANQSPSPTPASRRGSVVTITRGPRGFGFTFRSVRVYYGESDVYTLQHIVTDVVANSAAFEAGLSKDYLITHVNEEPVQGLLHTEVIKLVIQSGSKIALRAVPLEETSIRTRSNAAVMRKPAQTLHSHIGPNYGRMLRRLRRPKDSTTGKVAPQKVARSTAAQSHTSSGSRRKCLTSGNPSTLIRRLSSRRAENQMQMRYSSDSNKTRVLPRRWHSQQTQKVATDFPMQIQRMNTGTPDSSGISSPQTPSATISVTLTSTDSTTCSPLRSPKSPLKSPKAGRRAQFAALRDSCSSTSSSAFSSGSHDALQLKASTLLQIQVPLTKSSEVKSPEHRRSCAVTSPLARTSESISTGPSKISTISIAGQSHLPSADSDVSSIFNKTTK